MFYPHHHRFLIAMKKGKGGLTDEELALLLGASGSNARGRRKELTTMGYVEPSRTTRKTGAGRTATVWRLTRLGVNKVKQLETKRGNKRK